MEKSAVISDFVQMSKQDKRLANKKRKAEVLLNLLNQKKTNKRKTDSSDDSDEECDMSPAKKSKKSEELDEKTLLKIEKKRQKKLRLKEIRMQIKKLQKQESNPKERPSLHLTLQELLEQQVRGRPDSRTQKDELPTLYMLDVQHLLTLALLPDSYTHYPRWCKLARPSKVTSVVVIVLDQLGATDLEEYQHCFPFMKKTFKQFAEVVSPYQYRSTVMNDIFHVPFSNTALKTQAFKEIKSKDKIEKKKTDVSTVEPDDGTPTDFNRKHLLLNPLQLMHEGYPMPVKTVKDRYKDFQFSFKSYKAVTKSSPMFAVDCEMCMTTSGESELTRISVVNEKLETVYDTLVRPHNRITNYLTQYSGITKKMLDPVRTRLKEVQRKLRLLLPSDSIWLGQSLNNDLTALKMFHPYVIDTSVIYNLSGFKWKKTGLKILAAQFLKQDIQCGAEGHSSVEDAMATMELVQLKLKRGMLFGDATLSALEDEEEDMDTADKSSDKTSEPGNPQEEVSRKPEEKQNSEAEVSDDSEKPKAETRTCPTPNKETPTSATPNKETLTSSPADKKTGISPVDTTEHQGAAGDKAGTDGSSTVTVSEEPPVSRVQEKRRLFFQQHQGQYKHLLNIAHSANKSAVVIDKKENMTDLMSVKTTKCVETNSDKSRTQETLNVLKSADFVWVQLHGLGNLDTSTGEEEGTADTGEEEGTASKKREDKDCNENSEGEDGEIKDDPQKIKCLKRMDKRVRRIMRQVRSKSLVCVVLSGLTNQQSVHNGGVLIKIT